MKKIAIVDDEISILDVLERFLSRKQLFDIHTFENPKTALNAIETSGFDLVLCDIMMPQLDGIELVRQVKAKKPEQRFIMMTAYSTEDRLIECDKLGVHDYVTKPFVSLRDVENKVLDILDL